VAFGEYADVTCNVYACTVMSAVAIIWYYSHLWICSRSDSVRPVSETVQICLEKVLKKSLNW